jgi:hypothetical protein
VARVSVRRPPPEHLLAHLEDYRRWLENGLAPSTQRLYLAAARKAIDSQAPRLGEAISRGQLFWALHEAPWDGRGPRPARLGRFLDFLAEGLPRARLDLSPLRALALERVRAATVGARVPDFRQRRNAAFLAAACTFPDAQNPRLWPRACLRVEGHAVTAWGEPVTENAFAHALRLWAAWRDRLAAEVPRGAGFEPPRYAGSRFLFPARNGRPMARPRAHAVLRAALGLPARKRGERTTPGPSIGPLEVTPELVRLAFSDPRRWPDVPIGGPASGGKSVAPVPTPRPPALPAPPLAP